MSAAGKAVAVPSAQTSYNVNADFTVGFLPNEVAVSVAGAATDSVVFSYDGTNDHGAVAVGSVLVQHQRQMKVWFKAAAGNAGAVTACVTAESF